MWLKQQLQLCDSLDLHLEMSACCFNYGPYWRGPRETPWQLHQYGQQLPLLTHIIQIKIWILSMDFICKAGSQALQQGLLEMPHQGVQEAGFLVGPEMEAPMKKWIARFLIQMIFYKQDTSISILASPLKGFLGLIPHNNTRNDLAWDTLPYRQKPPLSFICKGYEVEIL